MGYGRQDTEWQYYLPDDGETADDANRIPVYSWQKIYDAEDAAKYAASGEWDNRDGWEAGINAEPTICVISPDGEESCFRITREAEVRHDVEPLEDTP